MKKSKKPSMRVISDDILDGDMTDFMLEGGWKYMKFELTKPKDKTITLRLSEELLNELKKKAERMGLDYQRLIRMTLESSLRKKSV